MKRHNLKSNLYEQTIALGALFQCCQQVHFLATQGNASSGAIETAINSLVELDPASFNDVYRGTSHLTIGLKSLRNVMQGKQNTIQKEMIRYAMGVLHLEKKLSNNPDMLAIIRSRLNQAKDQIKHFDNTSHASVIGNIAQLYQDTVSTHQFKIQVTGDKQFLTQSDVAEKIRVLLFGAIRAAFLWRQYGGRKYHLVTRKKSMATLIEKIIYETT